ncbi:uncharacterized protein LOC111101314 [Crassostrea virginica]
MWVQKDLKLPEGRHAVTEKDKPANSTGYAYLEQTNYLVLFDLRCLVANSTAVRQKTFKPYKTKKLTIICIITLGFSLANCPFGSVSHTDSGGELVCCKRIKCSRDFYVRTCQSNGTDDVCVPCDANTYLLDPTNSSYPLPCVKADCPPETVMVSEFPPSGFGCKLRCRCDEKRGLVGNDPCNCKRLQVGEVKRESEGYGKVSNDFEFHAPDQALKTAKIVVIPVFVLIVLLCCMYMVYECSIRAGSSKRDVPV